MRIKEAYAQLSDTGTEFFTIGELAERLRLPAKGAQQVAFRMARAGLARRVRRGLYALVEPGEWQTKDGPLTRNWYLAAAALAGPAPHYLAYFTAMEIHRMTQNPLTTVFLAVQKQRKELVRHGVRFRFVTVAEKRFFGYEEVRVAAGRTAPTADLERTFLDCVDRPELCGGLEEIFRGFVRRNRDLDRHRLLDYVQRLEKPFATKRLGFLLEAAGHDDARLLWDLERITPRTKQYVPLDKRAPLEPGFRNKRWELQVNVDTERLIAATRT